MRILVACEESQRVCVAFREKGHEAYSCDLIPCSGDHPEWHIQADALELLKIKWDMILAFPPCTYLTITGNRLFNVERYGDKAVERAKLREEAAEFFMKFVNADCPKIAIENPIGYMSTFYRKADQVIQPYQFGHPARKSTCLWLKGLPPLKPTNIVEPELVYYKSNGKADNPWHVETLDLPKEERAKARSKTYPGIAQAMADQWGTIEESKQITIEDLL